MFDQLNHFLTLQASTTVRRSNCFSGPSRLTSPQARGVRNCGVSLSGYSRSEVAANWRRLWLRSLAMCCHQLFRTYWTASVTFLSSRPVPLGWTNQLTLLSRRSKQADRRGLMFLATKRCVRSLLKAQVVSPPLMLTPVSLLARTLGHRAFLPQKRHSSAASCFTADDTMPAIF